MGKGKIKKKKKVDFMFPLTLPSELRLLQGHFQSI